MVIVPAGYYYPVPTEAEQHESFEWAERTPFAHPSVFDRDRLRDELERLIPFAGEFDPPLEQPDSRTYGWGMGMFGFSDAWAYYAMIRSRGPEVIVEVGSGASTLVALEAVRRNGFGKVVCVEPYPRPFLRELDVELVETPVQELAPSWFDERLSDGAFLFIDSSHAVRAGSDCVHLYLRVLPDLRSRLAVHVHDFHMPEGTPADWLKTRVFWTEQYLVYAYLLGSREAKVVYGSVANLLWHPELMNGLMHGRAPAGGASLWFELDPSAKRAPPASR